MLKPDTAKNIGGEIEMRITISRKELADALKFVNKACVVKSQIPIMSGIYLSATESCLELQATDNTLGIIAKIPANVEENGATVIVGKYFLETISKLNGDTVTRNIICSKCRRKIFRKFSRKKICRPSLCHKEN